MKKLAWVIGFVAGLLLLFTSIVIAINASDEPLSPTAQALVSELQLELKTSEGYDYLLGLTAPADQDPLMAGRMIREQSESKRNSNLIAYRSRPPKNALEVKSESKNCDGVANRPIYCGETWYKANASEVETIAKDNSVLLSRFDKLTSFASLNTEPWARSLVDTNVFAVHRLLRIKQDIWGLRWTNGDKESVIKEWVESNRFFNRWLEANHVSMIETMIVLHLLETQKKFALEVLKSDPKATAQFNGENLLSLKPTVSFDRLKKKVAASEFNTFYSAVRVRPTVGSIRMSSFGELEDSESLINKLPIPLLKQNATLNAFVKRAHDIQDSPCVTNDVPCEGQALEPKFTLINPIGKIFVSALSTTPATYKKMYSEYSSVSEL